MGRRVSQAVVVTMALVALGAGAVGGCGGKPGNPDPGGSPQPEAGSADGGGSADAPGSPDMNGTGAANPGGMPPAGGVDASQGGAMTPTVTMPPAMPPAGSSDEMPAEVQALLSSRCAGCHSYGVGDPAGWGSVLDVSRMIDADIIVAGRPDESRMIDRVAVVGNMPPKGPPLTAGEVALLRGWITGLGRAAKDPPTDDDILDLIAADQLSLRNRSSDYRYLSFAHQVGQGRPDAEMKSFRQVLSFALNSVSRRGELAELTPIDARGSIFRIDLAELGWNAALWDTLTSFYPYCVRSDAASHEALYEQLNTEAPFVRGDWFLATATKAPLYDELLDLPATVDQLAARLGIDINDDINHPGLAEPDNLVRVGFRRSGVALHNRLVERHLGAAGQYLWLTYDFDSSQGNQDLLSNPLGPTNRDQQNFEHTFQHVGGEAIFTLPNGLQGYMIVDAAGRRVAAASIKVLRDPRRRDGIVETGISCMGCHAGAGVLSPRQMDEVPVFTDSHIAEFLGRELVEIESTYPRALKPDPFASDVSRYRSTAERVPGGAPPADGDYGAFLTSVGQYESNVGFRGAAGEFSQEYESLRATIQSNDSQNEKLPRSTKQPLVSRDDFVCVFRDLVPKIRPNANFCARTFDAAAVNSLCD
jgi:mono/diheme cytochrome c family protein